MVIHIQESDGSAKCGANVYLHHEWDKDGNVIKKEKRISMRRFLYWSSDDHPATCKRCLNQVKRATTEEISENMVGKIFHRSFGYDMTINVFAKCIKQSAKSLICQECYKNCTGEPWGPGGTGKASAGDVDESKKPFNMYFKKSIHGFSYWVGAGETWGVWDGQPHYENHCD